MKSEVLGALRRLSAFGTGDIARHAIRCKLCDHRALRFDIVDFNKVCAEDYYMFGFSGISVSYYRCDDCGFVFTDFFDNWTNDEFATYIYNADYPLIDGDYALVRPARMAQEMTGFLADHRDARILDYGSGSGVFAERLRSSGFAAVHAYDPFASPARPAGQFDIVTCFETIEHSPFPKATVADLRSLMQPEGCIIFSTGLQPPNIGELRANWWYIAPRNGHVSIFTPAALELTAASAGLEFHAGGGMLAFAGPTPAPRLAPLLHRIGPVQWTLRLSAAPDPAAAPAAVRGAPAAMATRDNDWHAIEQSGASRFRWTQASRIEWTLEPFPSGGPCRLILAIPFVMEIVPGFAEGCRIEVDGRACPIERRDAALTATVYLDRPPPRAIALITPEPQRPADLRGTPDRRALGLAIPLATGG